MSTHEDDEGLQWEGDDTAVDPFPPRQRTRFFQTAAAYTPPSADGPGAGAQPRSTADSLMLVLYGVFAGVALLYTIGWLFVVLAFSNSGVFADPLPAVMYQLRLWLAVLAPALWGLAVMALIGRQHRMTRLVWLLLGAALLVPWPYLGVGA